MPPELATKIMELVLEKFPDRYERLAELRDRNPRRFEMLMRRMAPVALEYYKLREQQPELAETIIREFNNQERLHALSREYQEAAEDAARRAELEKEITGLVRSQVEFMEQRMEFRLKEFEERLQRQQEFLKAQRERLEQERARREERIAERIERIKKGDLKPDRPPFGPPRGEGPPALFDDKGPPGIFGGDGPPRERGLGRHPQRPRGRRAPDDERGESPPPPGDE